MEVIKVNDGDCFVLETKKDSLMVDGVDGKIHYRVILKDYKAVATMEINEEGGLTIKDGKGKVTFEAKGDTKYNTAFKCPNSNLQDWEEIVVCDIGYACDGCPYNPDLKITYKGVRANWGDKHD